MCSSMSEAKYVCSGDQNNVSDTSEHSFDHYGLGVSFYTHFTSPIRRYADIIVHRQLLQSIQNKATNQEQLAGDKLEEGFDVYGVKSKAVSLLEGKAKVSITGDDVKRVLKEKDRGEKGLLFTHEEVDSDSSSDSSNKGSDSNEIGEDFFNDFINNSSDEASHEVVNKTINDTTNNGIKNSDNEITEDFFNDFINNSSDEASHEVANESSNEISSKTSNESPISEPLQTTKDISSSISSEVPSKPSFLFTKSEMSRVAKHCIHPYFCNS